MSNTLQTNQDLTDRDADVVSIPNQHLSDENSDGISLHPLIQDEMATL